MLRVLRVLLALRLDYCECTPVRPPLHWRSDYTHLTLFSSRCARLLFSAIASRHTGQPCTPAATRSRKNAGCDTRRPHNMCTKSPTLSHLLLTFKFHFFFPTFPLPLPVSAFRIVCCPLADSTALSLVPSRDPLHTPQSCHKFKSP